MPAAASTPDPAALRQAPPLRLAARVALFAVALAAASLARADEAPARPRMGLALGGGSAKGLAHVGVLQWLEAHRIPVDLVAGTSMGGLIGGSYATGMSAEEIRRRLERVDWDLMFRPDAPYSLKTYRRKEDARDYPLKLELGLRHGVSLPSGLNPGHHIGLLLSEITLPYSAVEHFDDLPIPFRCTATDMRAGEAVVLADGSLGTALRATMAIPGLFDPVPRGDRLLADGGVLDNLPVDVARGMGAEVVIAVNVSAAAFDEPSESMVGLANRAISLMMDAMSRPRAERADVMIQPDLKGVGSADYVDSAKIIALGYAAAEAHAAELTPFALDPEAWAQHLQARAARRRPPPEAPSFVAVSGVPEGPARDLERLFRRRLERQGFDQGRFERDLNRIVGGGRYASASYRLAERDGQDGLEVAIREKTHAPPFLNLFVDVSNQREDVDFNLGARATLMDVGLRGSEWRLQGTFGATSSLATEYLLPVFRPTLFLAPRAFYSRTLVNLYDQGELVANYRRERSGGGADLVVLPGSRSQARLGFASDYLRETRRIGDPSLAETRGRETVVSAQLAFDGADEPVIPRHGLRTEARLGWYLEAPEVASEFGQLGATASWFLPAPGRDRALVSAEGSAVLGPMPTATYLSTLGGLFRLSAYGTDEFRGRYALVGRAGYLRSLAKMPALVGDRLFLLGMVELGSAFDEPAEAALKGSVSAGLIADTFFGPVLVGYAVGQDGAHRFYVSVGRGVR